MKRFTQIPNNLIKLPISPVEKIMLITLLMFDFNKDGKVFPSIKTLQFSTNLSRPTVIKAINKLEKLGFITKEYSNGKHSNYYINRELLNELTSKKTLPVTSKKTLPHRLKNFTGQKNVTRDEPVKNFYPNNTVLKNTYLRTEKNKKESNSGEVSPHPSQNSNGLQETQSSEIPKELLDLAYKGEVSKLQDALAKSDSVLFNKIRFELLPIARHNKKNPFRKKAYVPDTIPTVKSKPYTSKTFKPVDITDKDIYLLSADTFIHPGIIKEKLEVYKLWVDENEVKVKSHYNKFKLSFLSRIKIDWGTCNNSYRIVLSAREFNFEGGEKQAMKDYYRDLFSLGWLNRKQYWERIKKANLASKYEIQKAKEYGFDTDNLTPFNDLHERMPNETK